LQQIDRTSASDPTHVITQYQYTTARLLEDINNYFQTTTTNTTTKISHYPYTYDPGNRPILTTVTSDSHTIEYLYDAQDKHVGKKLDGVIQERYIYDGDDIALVVNTMGTLIDR
jgi:hypothetical protein